MAVRCKGAHVPQEISLMGVRWDVASPLSDRPIAALMEERGGPSDHATIHRGVVQYRPLVEEAFHRRQRAVWGSGRRDETDLTSKGVWHDLSRAVDKQGQTMDCLLPEQRAAAAALRFRKKALRRPGGPETSTSAGSAAQEAAIKRYNKAHGTAIGMRQIP